MSDLRNETNRRSPARVISEWLHGWTRYGIGASDLPSCVYDTGHEVDRIARDVGLTAYDLQRLARHKPDAAELLFCRMAALELNEEAVAELDRATLQDLQRVCTFCDCKGRCRRDLARDPDDPAWEDYCPNVGTLKMLDALPWSSRREG